MESVADSVSGFFDSRVDARNLPPPSAFKSQLNISDFAYSPKLAMNVESISPALRRSPRDIMTTKQSPLTGRPVRKRKTSSSIAMPMSPPPVKKPKPPSGYASPEVYAHLPPLPDVIEPNLICLFVGLNPGIRTSTSGHAYSHPSNLFWKLLYKSGCTTRLCRPEEDFDLPRLFALGNTNIVARPSRNGSELSKVEMDAGVAVLEEKIRRFRPEVVAIVGKSVWESVWRVKHGRPIKKDNFRYGWQEEEESMGKVDEAGDTWKGARVFVANSTSGLAATLLPAEKEKIWRELGAWVEGRRAERAGSALPKSEHESNN